jgi:carbamoyltransferase
MKQKDIYYGPTVLTEKPNGGKKTSSKEVADLLSKGKIIALYQGRSESGPRALGNRSILFDPRVKNGKDIVNKVKQREWFRPFAGTVLYEYAGEWFDLRGLKESPFMMYAVNVHENKQNLIPSIVHVDGSCRIQTLTRNQNKNYYDLINEFYKITGVPILFNTSFNLAGDCIVETLEDAQKTLANSDIDYLYLPEFNLLFN